MNRRQFLRSALGTAIGVGVGSSLFSAAQRSATATGRVGPYGPLLAPDANGLMLPAGFRSRVLAISGQPVVAARYVWHDAPDGGAVFPGPAGAGLPAGYVYVSNSEVGGGSGGTGALRFDGSGAIVDAYAICQGTSRNCAGGATPWGSWLSCEETDDGLVHECDPLGAAASVARPALGRFKHEAVAADPRGRRLYLTEDRSDGLLYRFTPDAWGDLSSGLLEAARVGPGGATTWSQVPNPNPAGGETSTRDQVAGARRFDGGEGIVYAAGHVYFTTKGDDRVWDHDVAAGATRVFYDGEADPARQLSGVDNIAATRSGDLLVAEDPGNLEIVLLTPQGAASPLVRITGQRGSEVTGPALDPTGRRLYFSSQRGGTGDGITYEVEGPFRHVAASG